MSPLPQSGFESMRSDPRANYEWTATRRRTDEPQFMRKGEVGDWVNYFSAEQSAEFDRLYAERMAGTGLDFIFSFP